MKVSNHFSTQFYIETFGRESWDNKTKFAFVRNPWDRAVSYFHYIKKWEKATKTKLKDYDCTFEEWVKNGCPYHYNSAAAKHLTPKNPMSQTAWLVDDKGELSFDFIGKVENIDEDYDKLCKLIGKKVGKVGMLNPSNRKNYREYYTEETQQIVADLCSDDITRFNYTF